MPKSESKSSPWCPISIFPVLMSRWRIFRKKERSPLSRLQKAARAFPGMSWSWMDINLDNGDTPGLWNVNFHGNQYNWVTVLKPDGTQPRYEGVAEVSGIYQGKHVTGFPMVEMV